MRFALGIEYDGEGFCGWQTQAAGCAIQNHVERAISQIAGHEVTLTSAARTDAGVHALGQVVHFDSEVQRPLNAWVRGVNSHLPAKISVTWVRLVGSEFHARYSARYRHYRYILLSRAVRSAITKVGWTHLPLQGDKMIDAAQYLLGVQDFSAFRSSECQAKTPIRTLSKLEIAQHGDYFIFDFSANAFLHHMVRNIIGSLVYVGSGKYPPGRIKEILDSRDRSHAAPTFSPNGLYLTGVSYDERWKFPSSNPGFLLLPV